MNINICFSSDNNYAKHMGCAITSILYHAKVRDCYNFYILDGGISQKNKNKIEKLKKIKDFNIEYYSINSTDFEHCPMTNYVEYITRSTYYRFKIPSLLRNVDKVLYLDCDIIAANDIEELFATNIDNYYMAAVPEVFNDYHRKRLEYQEKQYYCNAGVLLINNKKWIEDNIEKKLFEYAINPWREIIYQDQDILNEVLRNKIKYLPLYWNLQHDAMFHANSFPYHEKERILAIDNPKIIHFTNRKKPWFWDCPNKYKSLYYFHLKHTPWKMDYYKIKLQQYFHYSIKNIGKIFYYKKKNTDRTKVTIRILGIPIYKKVYIDFNIKKYFLGIRYSKKLNIRALLEAQKNEILGNLYYHTNLIYEKICTDFSLFSENINNISQQITTIQKHNKDIISDLSNMTSKTHILQNKTIQNTVHLENIASEIKLLKRDNHSQFYYEYSKNNKIVDIHAKEEYFNNCILFKYDYFNGNPKREVNLGDYIQTTATKNILKNLYPNINYQYFDRDNLSNYDGVKAFTIMQGWFSHSYTFMPNNKIIPVFIGTHISNETQEDLINFIKYNPNYFKNKTIGCRDFATKQFFNDLGIDAYLSRCLTLTFPKREVMPEQNKVFLVNIPKNCSSYLPKEILKDAEYINQRAIHENYLSSYYINSEKTYLAKTEILLNRYKNEARLIITNALHCAAPCIAMGIPVVLIDFEEENNRFSTLDNIIKIYTLKEFQERKIDYNIQAPNIELLKKSIIKNCELTIKEIRGEKINKEELMQVRNIIENWSKNK